MSNENKVFIDNVELKGRILPPGKLWERREFKKYLSSHNKDIDSVELEVGSFMDENDTDGALNFLETAHGVTTANVKTFVDEEGLTGSLGKLGIKTNEKFVRTELANGLEYYYSPERGESR